MSPNFFIPATHTFIASVHCAATMACAAALMAASSCIGDPNPEGAASHDGGDDSRRIGPLTEGEIGRSAESDGDREDWASSTDSLTPLESWAPVGATQLKAAATCHHVGGDWYGIAAAFHVKSKAYERDELWYAVVDGLSTWPTYGELVAAKRIDSFTEIRSVDCATNGASSFVVWDRFEDYGTAFLHKARLTRVAVDGYGSPTWPSPVEVGTHCGSAPPDPDMTVYAGTPRVAWEPGGRLLVAYNMRLPNGAATACLLCLEGFESTSLGFVGTNNLWSDLSNYPTFDLEWNGVNDFVVFYQWIADGATTGIFETVRFDRSASFTGGPYVIETNVPQPQQVRLTYTDNERNLSRLLVTTGRVTYWLFQSGIEVGEYVDPLTRWFFAPCEYWGPSTSAGQTYVSWLAGYTYHQQWRTYPASPFQTYHVDAPLPLACSSAETFTDPEVLLVSWSGLSPSLLS